MILVPNDEAWNNAAWREYDMLLGFFVIFFEIKVLDSLFSTNWVCNSLKLLYYSCITI